MELYDNDKKMLGVPEGVSYGQFERVNELNDRMTSRQFSDNPLQPNFDLRPESTKYARFPVLDKRAPLKENAQTYVNYKQSNNFNPGNDRAPVSGYFSNVDLETTLRNQSVALQHGANKGVFVPTSESELYKVHVVSHDTTPQPHPDLFLEQRFTNQVHPNLQNARIGNDKFNNHTRTQLRTSD